MSIIGVRSEYQHYSQTGRPAGDLQRSSRRITPGAQSPGNRGVPHPQRGIDTPQDRLFHFVVLSLNRVYQITPVRRAQALSARRCRSDPHRQEKRSRWALIRVGTSLIKLVMRPLISGDYVEEKVPWSVESFRHPKHPGSPA